MTTKTSLINTQKYVLSTKSIMCKIDINGIVEFASDYFIELSEYDEGEIIGKKIDSIFHPSTPKTITTYIWNSISNKKKISGIIKFSTKNNQYYWLEVSYDFIVDEHTREIGNIFLYANSTSISSILRLEKIYNKLYDLETKSNLKVANTYFEGLLEEEGVDYIDFINKYLK